MATNNKNLIVWLQAGLIVVLLVAVLLQIGGERGAIPMEAASSQAMNFISEHLADPNMEFSFKEAHEKEGLYEITFEVMGQEERVYVSKNGRYLFFEPIDMEEFGQEQEMETEPAPTPEPEANIDPQEMKNFVSCLEEQEFVVYGASWCGFSVQVIEMFGGKEAIDPIYVECTEQEELCREKEISGYPTVMINDQPYQGERSLTGFAEQTECLAPEGAEDVSGGNPDTGC